MTSLAQAASVAVASSTKVVTQVASGKKVLIFERSPTGSELESLSTARTHIYNPVTDGGKDPLTWESFNTQTVFDILVLSMYGDTEVETHDWLVNNLLSIKATGAKIVLVKRKGFASSYSQVVDKIIHAIQPDLQAALAHLESLPAELKRNSKKWMIILRKGLKALTG